MKRISLLSTFAALALAIALPGMAAAAYPRTFSTTALKAVCTNVNGDYGFGKLILYVSATAYNNIPGRPTPNYIVLINRRQEKIGTEWLTVAKSQLETLVTEDGGGRIIGLSPEAMSFESPDHPRTRMILRAELWDDLPTGDVRLKTLTERTEGC